MLRRHVQVTATFVTVGCLFGCSSVNRPYVPQTVGIVQQHHAENGLQVWIVPEVDNAHIGEPILFHIRIKNVGSNPFWIPSDVDILFTWIYPDGTRDNYLNDFSGPRFYSRRDAVLLKPGEYISKQKRIATYYFDKVGVTEFRALVYAPHNTNPELQPFWNGRVASNSFGIRIERSDVARVERGDTRSLAF